MMDTSLESQAWRKLATEKYDELDVLLELVTSFEDRVPRTGKTLLYLLVLSKYAPGVKMLLDRGANPNATSAREYTPLHGAALKGSVEMIRLLLNSSYTTNIEAVDESGATPMHHAVLCGQMAAVDTLLELGAQLHSTDNKGNTILHKAAAVGNVAMMKHLIDLGLNVNTKNESDWTALDVLKKYKHEELIEEIKAYANFHGPEPVAGTHVFEEKKQTSGLASLLSKFSGVCSKLGLSSCYKSTAQEENAGEKYVAMETYASGDR